MTTRTSLAGVAPALILVVTAMVMACREHGEHGEPPHPPGAHHGHPGPHDMASGHHRFENAEAWAAHFEDPARDAWQKPEALLDALAITPEMKLADIGSATGYFAVRLARRVPQGKVYGVDIEPDMIRYLNARAAREGLSVLTSVLGAPDDPKLPEPVDLALVVDTLHHLGDRPAYLARLRSYLRAGGRVVIVEFKKGELPVGPPEPMKLASEQVSAELATAGFAVRPLEIDLPYQYVLVATAAAAFDPTFEAEAQAKVQTFASGLQKALQTSLAAKGAPETIDMCAREAPRIAAELSSGPWRIRRVGTRVRNPETNTPTEAQRTVLARLTPTTPTYTGVLDGAPTFMKAIFIREPVCLTCHGDPASLPAAVKAQLAARYPKDEATGYRDGDLRGAFVVTRR